MIDVDVQPLDPADKRIEHQWRRLEELAGSSFFTSWDWTGTLFDCLPAKSGLSLLSLSKQTEIVGLAYLGRESALRHLLVRSHRLLLNSPGECLFIEDNLLIAQPELEDICWNAVLKWFAHSQTQAHELVLPGLRKPLDQKKLNLSGLHYEDTPSQSYHVDLKRLDATSGQFAGILSKNTRYQLRRSMRDYGGSRSLTLKEATSADEALSWFDNMKALHIESWTRRRKTHAFAGPLFEKFHRNLIQRTFSAGRIQMLCVEVDNRPIGYLYNFRDGPRTYAYQSGFTDTDRRLRPGAVSHALAIEHNFRLGVGTYDFLAGTNQLKTSFATDCRHLHWTTIQVPRLRFRLEKLARCAKQRLVSTRNGR